MLTCCLGNIVYSVQMDRLRSSVIERDIVICKCITSHHSYAYAHTHAHAHTHTHTQNQQMSTVMLDRVVDSENEDLMRRREGRVLSHQQRGGVEVADPYYHHTDYETSTSRSDSYYGSRDSMAISELPGYYSSSQPPDEHYESSDYTRVRRQVGVLEAVGGS